MIDALGCNSEPAKLSFEREIINFEFVEQIGGIDIHTNSQKRDKLLLRHGKKLFHERFEIKVTKQEEQKEIERLLSSINEGVRNHQKDIEENCTPL